MNFQGWYVVNLPFGDSVEIAWQIFQEEEQRMLWTKPQG